VPVQCHVVLEYKQEHALASDLILAAVHVVAIPLKDGVVEELSLTADTQPLEHGVLVQSLVVREHKQEQEVASELIHVVLIVLVLQLKPERVELSRRKLVKLLVRQIPDAVEVEAEEVEEFLFLFAWTGGWNVLIGHVLGIVPVSYITCT